MPKLSAVEASRGATSTLVLFWGFRDGERRGDIAGGEGTVGRTVDEKEPFRDPLRALGGEWTPWDNPSGEPAGGAGRRDSSSVIAVKFRVSSQES